jgi:hypothetical protein
MRLGTAWPAINGLDMVSTICAQKMYLCWFGNQCGNLPPYTFRKRTGFEFMELENDLRVFGCKVHGMYRGGPFRLRAK